MEVTFSFVAVLQHFLPVFTAPTFQSFVAVMSGWVLSPRHRYVTDMIFTGGNLDNGHWCRFHRFFSHAAWDLDVLSLHLAKLVVRVLTPGAVLSWAVDDTFCRKRGLKVYGAGMHADTKQPWTKLAFNQFGLHAVLQVKTQQALYYKAGGQRLLTIVLTRDLHGQRPDQMFYCTKLDWDARQILSAYACRWAIECTFENCKQFLGLEDPANRLPRAVQRTAPMALLLYSLVVVWFHQEGHRFLRFPYRPWYRSKREPSFADLLTTLRRVSCEEKTETLVPKQCRLKTWLTQITELLSRTG